MRWLAALAATLVLAACGAPETEPLRSRPRYYGIGEVSGAGQRLIPYTTLSGYMLHTNTREGGAFRTLTGLDSERPLFSRPSAVAATAGGVYVIDENAHALYRFRWSVPDPAHAAPQHVAEAHAGLSHPDFTRLSRLDEVDEAVDLFVSDGGDVYVADGSGRKVRKFDAAGELVQTFESAEHLNKPVAITIDARGLRIFVADGLFDRIVVFNPQGSPLYGIGRRGDEAGEFRNIRDMVQGRDGLLYIVDGIRRHVGIYGLDGSFVGSFAQGAVTDPSGIAVDDEGRIYVADRFNHRILIFKDRKLVESFGTQGPDAGQFNQPSGIAYHDRKLYVADRDNGRVQVFRVVPEAVARQAKGAPGP